MRTADELRQAFAVYFAEMDECENSGCYWALLHLLVTMPDICSGLDGEPQGGHRYVKWCNENFEPNPKVRPGDRYQMRNALLHQGTTLPDKGRSDKPDQQTQYMSFSFLDPRATDAPVHQAVNPDVERGGDNLTVNVKDLADETRQALRKWFELVEINPTRNATVEANLPKLASRRPKVWTFTPPITGGLPISITRNVTSST
jgi:hypothetical protein